MIYTTLQQFTSEISKILEQIGAIRDSSDG